MMKRAIVIFSKGLTIYDDKLIVDTIPKDTLITYERFFQPSREFIGQDTAYLHIFSYHTKRSYSVPDFIIEGYVQNLPEPLLNYQSDKKDKCIQIQKFDSVHNTNEFLKTIPKENVIKIEPLENNTYLVTYSEEMK